MRRLVCGALVLLGGCSGDGSTSDDGINPDSGPSEDGGPEPPRCTESAATAVIADGEGDFVWPTIAAAGDRVVVAWHSEAGSGGSDVERLFVRELDRTGAPQGDAVVVSPTGRSASLTTSGNQIALAWREVGTEARNVRITLIDDGAALRDGAALPDAEPTTAPSIVGAPGGAGFGVAYTVDPSDLMFVRLDGNGQGTPPAKPLVVSTVEPKPRIIARDSGFAIFYYLPAGVRMSIVEDTGMLGGSVDLAPDDFVPWDPYLSSLSVSRGGDRFFMFGDNPSPPVSSDHAITFIATDLSGAARVNPITLTGMPEPSRRPSAVWTGENIALVSTDGSETNSYLSVRLFDRDGQGLGGNARLAELRGDAEFAAAIWLGDDGMVAYSAGEPPERTINVVRFSCE